MSTIAQIIALVDETKPNAFSESVKVRWIAELDGKIAVDVFLMHHSETAQLNYKWPESMNTEPLVPFPHDDIYALWLKAKIDDANGESNEYQNSMESYNESYSNFRQWFVRTHRPAQGCGNPQQSDATQYYITAYGLAVRQGFTGTLDDWLRSLIGPRGNPGMSPYEFARAGGFAGTEEDFLYKLLHDGKTAWEYAVEGGYAGTEEEFTALMASLAQRLPAVEAAENPGCYYRMVDGEREWINPPMEIGTEYRTTERYGGNPVYTKMFLAEPLPNAATKEYITGISASKIIRYNAMAHHLYGLGDTSIPVPHPVIINGQPGILATFVAKTVQIVAATDLSSCFAMFQIWYIK